jgi:hypothetical protein
MSKKIASGAGEHFHFRKLVNRALSAKARQAV